MSWFYRKLVRPVLFKQQAECAHTRTLHGLARVSRSAMLCGAVESLFGAPELPIELFSLRFPNPVGLAAGMDKNAEAVPGWAALGFGFSELGGVTWHAQPGNPEPRMFRAVTEEAIVNRMGFNNHGAQALAEKLTAWRASGHWPAHPIGVNLGKSKITPLENAAEDYANSFRVLRDLANFFVVNVSSPNTPNLRQLQDKTALDEILAAIHEANTSDKQEGREKLHSALTNHRSSKPILVKVAPDLSFDALDQILELVGPRQIAGIIATNTTITRPDSGDANAKRVYAETGGLSGRPLRSRSTAVVRHLFRQTRAQLPIIGVGGISSADDAWEKITAGASLIQIYTGLVYEGPGLPKRIVSGLVARLKLEGLIGLKSAVGIAVT